MVGLGQIGARVAQMCLDRPDTELAAAVVFTPAKVAADIGTLVGRQPIGVGATADPLDVARSGEVDVVVYCALGDPRTVAEALGAYAERGKDVVTVTGLVHPVAVLGRPAADVLAARAARGQARIVGIGWNPGFLLDVLPATWASFVPNVRHVFAERVSDLCGWGDGVLDGLGIGRREADLSNFADHMPLAECVRLIADATGVGAVDVTVGCDPTFAAASRASPHRRVDAGEIGGFEAVASGCAGGEERIRLRWTGIFALDPGADGRPDSVSVRIAGDTTLTLTASGTTFSDAYPATATRALNIIAPLRRLPPGLYRPDQVPLSA
ncbi:MAG: hypothetical protein JWN32_480 [Solirubrobacterales bacterium]|nr:hypothetical protein [Solirubrobacterales bacterium]